MFDKIYKFFEEMVSGITAEAYEEEYLASYDATAGKILRQEEVKLRDAEGLDQCACDDPVQKGILAALSDYEQILKETRKVAIIAVAKELMSGAKHSV